MTNDRDEHDGIAQLDDEHDPPLVGARPRARASRRRHAAVLIALAFVVVGLLLGAAPATTDDGGRRYVTENSTRWLEPSSHPAGPPADLSPALGFHWYPQPLVKPIFVDVDLPADGKNEIIGLAWQSGEDSAPLDVVAIDPATGRARWRAGPYTAHWASDRIHLLLLGATLVVSDSHERLHVLDVHTGQIVREPIALNASPAHMCQVHEGPPALLFNDSDDPRTRMQVDLLTGAVSHADPKLSCETVNEQLPCRRGVVPRDSCATATDANLEARIRDRADMRSFSSTETLVSEGSRIVLGYREASGGSAEPMAVSIDPKTKKVVWSARLVAPEDTLEIHAKRGVAPLTLLAHGHLYFVYESGKEPLPYRLVARSAATGEVTFQVDVPTTGEGSWAASLSEDAGRVFVLVDQTLFVFDGTTGSPITRIPAF